MFATSKKWLKSLQNNNDLNTGIGRRKKNFAEINNNF